MHSDIGSSLTCVWIYILIISNMNYHRSYSYQNYYRPHYMHASGYMGYPSTEIPPGSQFRPQRNYNNLVGHASPHYMQQFNQPVPQHQYRHPHHHVHQSCQSSQSQQRQNFPTPYVPNFLVTSGTGLTPTLTPTTLTTIDQAFIDYQANGAGRDPVTQSGFVPPVVDPSHSTEQSQDSYASSSDTEWEPRSKRIKNDSGDSDYIVTANGTIDAAPQRKYTRRSKEEKLAPEEEEKRRVRRERNKIAAAKCRQRRVDHTNELVEETEKLEAEKSQLVNEIQTLQQEKDQLEFILQAHQPLCKAGQVKSNVINHQKVKPDPSDIQNNSNGQIKIPPPHNLNISSVGSNSITTTTMSELNTPMTPTVTSRPNSLPLIKREHPRMLSVTSATGVTINTPTSGVSITPSSLFGPTLENIVDGSTGLTPLTGMSCSSQLTDSAVTSES